MKEEASPQTIIMSQPSSSSAAAFEACFAQGLDLSEFAANTKKATTATSHAAQHLATTAKRAADRVAADQQEWALTTAVQAKSRAAATRSKPSAAHAAVLQMHNAVEETGRQRLVKKGPKTLAKKKNAAKRAKPTKGKRRGK